MAKTSKPDTILGAAPDAAADTAPNKVASDSSQRVAILGPHGTFTEEAFLTQADLAAAEVLLCPTIADVLHSVEEGVADLGFVALENSIEGGINITLDNLAFKSNLLIQREVILPVHLHLWGLDGATLKKIKHVFSFPQAISQCHGWLGKNLDGAETHAADSTATAIRMIAEGGDVDVAAIGTTRAGELHKLNLLAENVADHLDNKTRFVAVGVDKIPAPTRHDKTSIVVFMRKNQSGVLMSILQEFAARNIDLTRLESRPTKETLGEYCFIIDFWGHIEDDLIADCLMNIRSKYADIKFLGSYPVAGNSAKEVQIERAEQWADNKSWLADLRKKIV